MIVSLVYWPPPCPTSSPSWTVLGCILGGNNDYSPTLSCDVLSFLSVEQQKFFLSFKYTNFVAHFCVFLSHILDNFDLYCSEGGNRTPDLQVMNLTL